MRTIAVVLSESIAQLISISDTPRLDAEILLAHVLKVSRSYLYAWPEKNISEHQCLVFHDLINKRLQAEPIAYIVGHQEFWSLNFQVTPDVLIPRSDTELLVELVLKTFSEKNIRLAELGTGSGAIALALAHEYPDWEVHATDYSEQALAIAKINAKRLSVKNITFHHGDWLQALPNIQFNAIISNPPYIPLHDACLLQGGLSFEPKMALVSGLEGLDAIKKIIIEAKIFLQPNGYVFLEHGYDQAERVRKLFSDANYVNIVSYCDISGIERVTVAQL